MTECPEVVVLEGRAWMPGAMGAVSDAGGRFTIHALHEGSFELVVLEKVDGHASGLVHDGPSSVVVELKTRTDQITGVQLRVRRVAPNSR